MILKKITIQNISSIEHAEVDFLARPLCDAELFLIHGETGAGKSTLIDAICLALYKNTPRLKSAPKDKLKFGNYELTSQDSANMLRHGTTDGMAKLEFEGNDKQSYTAVWTAHRTPKAINIKHYLLKESVQIAEGRVMDDLIQADILGMNFDDFCRTAVLAQGEFTRFLKCDEKEKSAILEKLTGTEYFSSVGRMIYTIWKEKDDQYRQLSADVEGIRLLSKEELEAIEKEVAETKSRCEAVDSEIGRFALYRNWLIDDKKYLNELQHLQQEYEKVLAQCSSAEYKLESIMLSQWDLSQQAISDYKECEVQKKVCEECKKTEQELSVRLSTAYSGVAFARQKIEHDQAILQQLSQKIERQMPHKDMFENCAAVVSILNQFSYQKEQIVKIKQSHELLVANKPILEKGLAEALEGQKKVQNEIEVVKQKIADQSKLIEQLNPDRVDQETTRLNARSELLHNASMSLKELDQAITADENSRLALEEIKLQHQSNIEVEKQLLDNMNSAKQSLEVADRVMHTINMATDDWAVKARAALNDGDKCPVCGGEYNALHFNEVIESVRETEKMRYESSKRKYDVAAEAYNKKRLEQELILRSIDSMINESKNHLKRRADSLVAARQYFEQLDIRLLDDSRDTYSMAVAEGMRLKNENKVAIEENLKRRVELNELTKNLGLLNNAFNSLNEQNNKAVHRVNSAKQALDRCQAEIKSTKEAVAQFEKHAQDLLVQANRLITWPNWCEEWAQSADTFVAKLQSETEDYRKAKEYSATITVSLERQRAELASQEQQLKMVSQSWPQWSVASVDPRCVTDLSAKCNELATDSAILIQRQRHAQSLVKETQTRLADFYQQHADIQEEMLRELVAFDAANIRMRHVRKDQELSVCKGKMDVGQQQLQNHRQNQPWGLEEGKDEAYYEEKIASLDEEKSSLSQLIGAKNKELSDNEQHVREQGEKLVLLQQQKNVLDQWYVFCNLYGDTNGTKFRRLAQQLVFDRLLQLANQQLARINGRYLLETIPGSLSISLRDQYASDFCSPVFNLSGGESFMVSLSLALALSNMGQEGIAMDTLFIDEGFGTLSVANQVKVMDLLQTLQHEQGKRVGIISHVPYLLERIPIQIKVERIDGTRSKVEIVDYSI